LEHGSLLLKRIIIAFASAKPVAKVLVVLVIRIGLLGMHPALAICRLVEAESARARGRKARGSAIACEIALGEDLDERVLAMALD
jgi:hypothetical protein